MILDSDSSIEGTLTVQRVQEAVRLLGTSFFQEMTALGKRSQKSKVYDHQTLFSEDMDTHGEHDDSIHMTQHDEWNEGEWMETLVQEGDADAIFVSDFETAAADIVQADEDLAAACSSYVEARRKLSEKVKSRGYWPISKGKGKGFRNKGKGKQTWGLRKSLQQKDP